MKRLALTLTALTAMTGAAVFAAVPAKSDNTLCGNRNEIVKSLDAQFNEKRQAVGVVDKNAVLEIFVSDGGSWTILATGTDGNACLVSSGEGWDSKSMVIGVDA